MMLVGTSEYLQLHHSVWTDNLYWEYLCLPIVYFHRIRYCVRTTRVPPCHPLWYYCRMAGIRDIAQRAGVSIGTVDRVLHGRGGVAESTITRVRDAMRELHYEPDIHASNMSTKRTYRFGALLPELSQDSGFWRGHAAGIESARNELQRFRVHVSVHTYDEWDSGSFLKQVDRSLDEEVLGLLVAPATVTDQTDAFRRIPRDIPYVLCDSYLPGTSFLSYVGENSVQAGRTAGRLMTDMVHSGTILAFRTLPGTLHIDRRIAGFEAVLANHPNLQCVRVDLDFNRTDAEIDAFVSSVLSDYPDISGVFISNGEIHRIIPAIKRHRAARSVRLVGFDMIPENRELLRQGNIDYIIGQRPEEQAYIGINLLYRHVVLQQPCPREVILPIDIVSPENVEQYSAILTTSVAIESALQFETAS